jgi:hypothetical protein
VNTTTNTDTSRSKTAKQRLFSNQCTQNLQESSTAKSPSSPEYTKASLLEDSNTEDSETDDSDTSSDTDSDTSSDTTKQYAWSVSSGSSDEETEE